MDFDMLRRCVAAGWLPAVSVFLIANAQTSSLDKIQRFFATTANISGAGEQVRIDLIRWSTDAEREQFLGAVSAAKDESALRGSLEKLPTLGYVWTGESAGYSVKYAHRTATPEAGEHIVVVTDRRLGSWQPRQWVPAGTVEKTDYPYSVIEFRLNRSGTGEGKASLAAKVLTDKEAKTIALENYAAAPVLLKGVKREGAPSSAVRGGAAGNQGAPAKTPGRPPKTK
jgi:hypothetical protein